MRRILAALLTMVSAVAYAQANPAARVPRDITALAGTWNGAHLEQRSACRTSQNDGFHGTYAAYGIYVDTVGHSLVINETGVTGLTCTWSAGYRDEPAGNTVIGTLSCSDGRTGSFESQGFFATATLMSMRLSIRLSGTESCTIDAILSGARF